MNERMDDGVCCTLACILHRSASKLVLSSRMQPGHEPAESIAGKYFPEMNGGKGGMVIITDGCTGPLPPLCLHAYISTGPGDMENFVPATQPYINSAASTPATGPAGSLIKGNWVRENTLRTVGGNIIIAYRSVPLDL